MLVLKKYLSRQLKTVDDYLTYEKVRSIQNRKKMAEVLGSQEALCFSKSSRGKEESYGFGGVSVSFRQSAYWPLVCFCCARYLCSLSENDRVECNVSDGV